MSTYVGRILMVLAVAMLALAGQVRADNLIANGDFSQPLEIGWTTYSTGDNAVIVIDQAKSNSVRVSQSFKGKAALYQVIPVSNPDLTFSFSAQMTAEATKEGYGALADVAVIYCDADNNTLGRTAFARAAGTATLTNSGTDHMLAVRNDDKWNSYTLDIAKELKENLTGIDPDQVKLVRIELAVDNGEATGC